MNAPQRETEMRGEEGEGKGRGKHGNDVLVHDLPDGYH